MTTNEHTAGHSWSVRLVRVAGAVGLAALLALSIAACDDETEREVDDVVDQVQRDVTETTHELEQDLEAAGDRIGEELESAGERLQND